MNRSNLFDEPYRSMMFQARMISRIAIVMLLNVLTTVACCRAADGTATRIAAAIDAKWNDAAQANESATQDSAQYAKDAVFLRRASLDLIGRIPTVSEVRDYLEDPSESKRDRALSRLLKSGAFSNNMATVWRRAWVPQADTPEFASVRDGFEAWLEKKIQERTPYDHIVREVITFREEYETSSISAKGFYLANESKPANLAASSTRAFLGLNLDCAQCHDHPFSRWTRAQFWETAAFFAPPTLDEAGDTELPRIHVPDTDLEYVPRFLSGEASRTLSGQDSDHLRERLVDWMTQEDQRFMAKNAVNRTWAHFFGSAIVEPMDDLSSDAAQQGAQAELLDELAQLFIAGDYDLQAMIEGIVRSNAYRLTSQPTSDVSNPKTRGPMVRGLSGEQLFDSLSTAAGLPHERHDLQSGNARSPRQDFAAAFYVERVGFAERSISQSLTMMNGSFVNSLADRASNKLIASVVTNPFMQIDERIDTVFLAVLGRHTVPAELQQVKQRLELNSGDRLEQKLGDLFWVLVNTPEFHTNR
ncbi:MAG: DUF1549 domain-containing protein [Pirellulales bacterium]